MTCSIISKNQANSYEFFIVLLHFHGSSKFVLRSLNIEKILDKNHENLFNSTQNERILLYFNSLTHFQLYTNYSLTLH